MPGSPFATLSSMPSVDPFTGEPDAGRWLLAALRPSGALVALYEGSDRLVW